MNPHPIIIGQSMGDPVAAGTRIDTCRMENGTSVGRWSCEDGDVIDCFRVCNGLFDCDDGSDETALACRDML